MAVEGLLERVQRAVGAGEALDGPDRAAVCLDGEHEAGPHRLVVEQDGAAAAHAVLAADVRPGQAEVVPEEVGEQPARLDLERRAGRR